MSVEINVTNEVVEINEVSEIVEINVTGGIGPAGAGVPAGGTTGQVLAKDTNDDYDTEWIDINAIPYVGATTNVDLGEFELKAGQVEFDQTPIGTAGVGVMRWNDTDGTVDLGLKGGNVTLQVGQEQVARIVNKSGVNLTEAEYQVVKVLGAQGQRLSVTLAQANNDAGSAETLGIVTENININQEGYITTSGLVRGIDTRGVLQGETWAEGDMLYLSGTTAGALTKVKPIAPIHSVVVGYVINAAPSGSIFVKVTNGQELDELHNVAIVSVANNEALIYESATSLWKNKTIASALGYTPQAALTLTTTGTSGAATLTGATLNIPQYSGTNIYNADGTLTGNRTVTSGGYTLTFNGAGNTEKIGAIINNVLLLNTSTPIVSAGIVTVPLQLVASSGSEQYAALFSNNDKSKYLTFSHTLTDHRIYSDYTGGGALRLVFGTYTNRTNQLVLFTTGNISLGSTTDAGYKLDVNGTARVSAASNYISNFYRNNGSDARISIQNTTTGNANDTGLFLGEIGVNSWLWNYANGYLLLGTNNVEAIRILPSGFVGIATTNPTANLHIVGGSGFPIKFERGTNIFGFNMSTVFSIGFYDFVNSIYRWRVNNTDLLLNETSGNVGIGLSTILAPSACGSKLQVNGNVAIGYSAVAVAPTNGLIVAGNVNIGTDTSVASSVLQVSSTTQGFLPPRMTTTQKNAISTPAAGLMVFDTTLVKLCVYSGTAWETITSI